MRRPSSPHSTMSLCSDRCHRLLRRSLDRLDTPLGVDEVLYRIGAFRKSQMLLNGKGGGADSSEELALPAKDFKEICWKFFDFEDCQKQCQKMFKGRRRRKKRRGIGQQQQQGRRQRTTMAMQAEHRIVLHFCRRTDFGIPLEQFACVHKYHSFMEVHCSTFQQRAVHLRLIGLQLQNDNIQADKFGGKRELEKLKKALDQELCLLLHRHSSCLVNTGTRFCPTSSAALLISRSSLRDHFLSLLLPFGRAIDQRPARIGQPADPPADLDQLFSEPLLDHCQLFDFHKMAEEWMERMQKGGGGEVEDEEEEEEDGAKRGEFEPMAEGEEQRSTTKRAVLPKSSSDEEGVEVTVAPSNRRVFSSEEDLMDTPPNFFYSTARLPKDFYTRYTIWWGSRGGGGGGGGGREESEDRNGGTRNSLEEEEKEEGEEGELTAVQLLPSASPPRAHSQITLNPSRPILEEQRRTTMAQEIGARVGETGPDSTLSTPVQAMMDGKEGEVGWSVTMPYLVNGRATTPVDRWPGEMTTTEIRLMDGTKRKIWTASEREEEEWKRREATEMDWKKQGEEGEDDGEEDGEETRMGQRREEEEESRRRKGTPPPIEEYEEEWAYEDEFGPSQFEEDNSPPRILKPVISSSVEELIEEIEPKRKMSKTTASGTMDGGEKRNNGPMDEEEEKSSSSSSSSSSTEESNNVQLLPFYTTAEPLFRETNIYFAKILEFGQEPEADAEWMHGERKETSSPKTVAHMVHYPGDQLPIREDSPNQAELDPDQNGRWPGQRHRDQQSPYEIRPADPNQFMVGPKTTTPINWRRGGGASSEGADSRSKILVSAEPVPAKKSETLLVLLGLYLAFFALASFFLFCLILTCLERNRRQASRRQSAKRNSGSAILYMDPKKGTLKHVV